MNNDTTKINIKNAGRKIRKWKNLDYWEKNWDIAIQRKFMKFFLS